MTGNETPIVSVWLLGKFHVEWCKDDGTRASVGNAEWAGSYARPLFKRLLSATDRRATRSDLIDDLWSGDRENAEQYLYVASSKLRKVFDHKEIITSLAGGYELAGPAVLWTDIHACKQLMAEADRRGLDSADAILLLEEVSTHFARGGMLEGENGKWCVAFRHQQEEAMRYCHIMLAKGYEAQKKLWLAREQYQRLFEINPLDEEALCYLLAMLHRHGLIDSLRSSYKEARKRFEKEEMALSETTTKLFEHLMQSPPSFAAYLTPPREIPRPSESEAAQQPDPSLAQTFPMAYNESSQSSSLPRLEMPEMLMESRRQAFSDIVNVALVSFVLSPYALLSPESREHLELMMTRPSYVDDEAIALLAGITQNHWSLREKYAAIDLLDGIKGHFQTIIQLLKEARSTDIYEQLGALASENAQILGRTFHEMREFDLSWKYYGFALKMAQEIHHTDLWASGAVRLAELIITWGEPQEALPFLNEAHKRGIRDQRLRVWLSSVEAQIYARTGNMDKFLTALGRSKKITLPESLVDDIYRTDFNDRAVARCEGDCLMWLHEPERALPLLKERLATYAPTSIRPRSLRLAEIGRVYGQLGDVKKACELLLESLGITAKTKSLVTLQRIYQGRSELDPWKDSVDVKDLDAQIVEVYKNLARVKERV